MEQLLKFNTEYEVLNYVFLNDFEILLSQLAKQDPSRDLHSKDN